MTNIRIASCGGGYAKLALRDADRKIAITLGHLIAWNTPSHKVARVKGYIERTIEGFSTPCEVCSIELPLLVFLRLSQFFVDLICFPRLLHRVVTFFVPSVCMTWYTLLLLTLC